MTYENPPVLPASLRKKSHKKSLPASKRNTPTPPISPKASESGLPTSKTSSRAISSCASSMRFAALWSTSPLASPAIADQTLKPFSAARTHAWTSSRPAMGTVQSTCTTSISQYVLACQRNSRAVVLSLVRQKRNRHSRTKSTHAPHGPCGERLKMIGCVHSERGSASAPIRFVRSNLPNSQARVANQNSFDFSISSKDISRPTSPEGAYRF